jgi:serine/threonine protein kinase
MTLARIGRFQVERTLGSGSFATVWLARDEDLDAWVAIKLLAENWAANDDARRRFIEEARALRRLDNDRIVRVYEVGRLPDDRPYMVMEYADRGTLEDRMKLRGALDQPFSIREAVEISMEIAACLASVHGHRIVHRDVKPSNVLFRSLPRERQEAMRRDGEPVVSERTLLGDFGIARRLEGALGHTVVVGSPLYMAPEQADPARAGQADYRSDVYSGTIILFELLTGELPYHFDSVAELQRSTQGAPSEIRDLRPDVPDAVAAVVLRGLARDPEARFESAWEWRSALRAALLDGASQAVRHPETEAVGARVGPRSPAVPSVSTLPAVASPPAVSTLRAPAGPPLRGSTLPAETRKGTDALNVTRTPGQDATGPQLTIEPARQQRRAPVRTVDLRLQAVWTMAAALAMFVAVMLRWSSDTLGIAFRESALAVAAASVVLFLGGWRMWRTHRRWVAAAASTLASVSGLAVASFGLFMAIRVAGRDQEVLGPGLLVIVVAGLVAFAAGYLALKRLRLDRHH